MQSEEYNKMIEVVRMFNAKKISKEEMRFTVQKKVGLKEDEK